VPDPGAGTSGLGHRHTRAPRRTAVRTPTTSEQEAPIARTPKPRTGGDDEAPPPRRRRAAAATKALSAAGPDKEARPAPRRPEIPPDRLEELVTAARGSLEDDKAEDIQVLDVTGRASFTDRMVIATGLVERQLQAMATHLEEALEKAGLKLRRDAIQASPDWVLIDAGDLVVHLFRPEARATYALERMWGPDSPQGEAPAGNGGPANAARSAEEG
jgi:ribosome silencing factor RsfS/YbeB/iojap